MSVVLTKGTNELNVSLVPISPPLIDLDSWDIYESYGGTVELVDGYVELKGKARRDFAGIRKDVFGEGASWDKNRSFKVVIEALGDDFEYWLLFGWSESTEMVCFTAMHTSFYGPQDAIISCFVRNGEGQAEGWCVVRPMLRGYRYTLEAKYYASSHVDFYVDGALIRTISNYLPTGSNLANLFTIYNATSIPQDGVEDRILKVYEIETTQE